MRLQLEIEGGSSTEEQRAIEATKAVFAAARISSEQAVDGMSAVETWGDAGCHDDQAPVQDEDMDGCQQGGDRVVGLMWDCDPPSQKEPNSSSSWHSTAA
ncbi:hypothetical protein LB557_06205 [Mesorhizobium sp. BR115XR7A]|uniref:hypothetical protein n=1 Tax=Mesorhizobium sp. BR115XR7A TaxID=2876645 RepID=UPI001CCEA42A|nr:hypothetical protein [Mesorhizobium sp. BR115XR7A]MBZ9905589.1 hypothetical protein [Mesorhizobium sp. BR115XR7A]MBZ9931782.1 hypothetical protein [Mesorhizobium sp. BR1-1-5]